MSKRQGIAENSPSKSPWSTDNTFVRSRFIIRRLKRMRNKARSMHDETPASCLNGLDSAASYESLIGDGQFNQNKLYFFSPDTLESSAGTRELLREEVVMLEEPEYAEALEVDHYTLSRSRASRSVQVINTDSDSKKGSCREKQSKEAAKNHHTDSFSSADSFEFAYEENKYGMDLLEEIEKSLPREYSLKRPLPYCYHSVTMHRALLRLTRQPCFPKTTPVIRKSLSLKNVSKYIENELLRLKVELMVQKTQVEQARRALEVSAMHRTNLLDHLEAERTLLIASTKHTTVQEEIQNWTRLQYLEDVLLEEESGSAIIREITIFVEKEAQWSSYYFVLVTVERDNVRGTEMSTCTTSTATTPTAPKCIQFKTPLHFSNLRPNFRITFYLYGITLKDPKHKFFHRSNEFLNFLHKPSRPKWRNSLVQGIEHNFQLIGISEIQSSHFSKSPLFLTTMVPNMTENPRVDLKGVVYLDTLFSGFLDIRYCTVTGAEKASLWVRYWCRLSGIDLLGWHDPSHTEIKNTSFQMSLSECISREVGPVGPFDTARPNTFQLLLKASQALLCSADSQDQMLSWCYHINKVLKASSMWNNH